MKQTEDPTTIDGSNSDHAMGPGNPSNSSSTRALRAGELPPGAAKLQLSLKGFTQIMGLRVFAFEVTTPNRARTEHTVQADITLARKYGITIQELPIMCRKVLEQHENLEQQLTLIFSEDEMKLHANKCTDARNAASLKKKSYRPVRAAPVSRFQVGGSSSPILGSANRDGLQEQITSRLP